MAEQRREEPIIFRKRRRGEQHAHHGGAWKVAYADFVTAMMAFFLVMWIMQLSESARKAIASYFNEPGAFHFLTGKALPIDIKMRPARYVLEKGADYYDNFSERGGPYQPFPIGIGVAGVSPEEWKQLQKDSAQASQRLEEVQKELQRMLQELATTNPEIGELLGSLRLEMTPEGLRIELLETRENLFFRVGSAELRSPAVHLLQRLGIALGKLPNYVEIEGHTDSRSYSPRSPYTNWELSADRANAARRVLETSGLWSGQVSSVVGYADRKLRVPENPFDTSNRRVSILVRKLTTLDFLRLMQAQRSDTLEPTQRQ
ncbi:MAG: OmpA family protein [Candidatus Kapabacteria bacterium]|nr:OmpA family protein [Candidatus Kapabacteria bacterium]MCS7169839.1 OmpA family protein [Candidatus Kapabacteria bacterium]MDW7996966.1 flagellar motor protein MotB [Bacteroidota bacterium]MDW8225235.1 flagellar motor protein MotB [Bacteroidota bacterium]